MEMSGLSVSEFDEINAKLCRKRKESQAADEILYSYWKIIYTNGSVTSELVLNAVTGQVLRATITPLQYTPALIKLDRVELLCNYSASFQLGDGNILGEKWGKRELYYFFNIGRLHTFLKIEDTIEKEMEKKAVIKRKKSCLFLSIEPEKQTIYDVSGQEANKTMTSGSSVQ